MAHCNNCGAKVAESAGYCDECGVSLTSGQGGHRSQRQSGQQPQEQPQQGGQHPQRQTQRGHGQPQQTGQSGQPERRVQPQQGAHAQGGQPQGGRAPPGGRAGSDDGYSRRALLLGGAGTVAAAGAGGWYFFLRSTEPTGAAAVAGDYIDAIGDNDWERAGALFHEASPPQQTIESSSTVDTYEDYLREEDFTDVAKLRELDPTIEDHKLWNHYPEYDQEAAQDLDFSDGNPPVAVEEIKQISTVIEGNVSSLYDGEQSQHFARDTSREAFFATVVNDGSDWALWSMFHPV